MLYCPRGPVFSTSNLIHHSIFIILQNEVSKIASQESVLNFELDPQTNSSEWLTELENLGFRKTSEDTQPRHTLILELRHEKEELLSNMHSKTRYNIRLAKKKQIEIEINNEKFKDFHELLKKTEGRQKIFMQSADYFKKLLDLPFVKLYLAKYEGKVIAANIMIFWNHTATYLFGASDYEHRKLMAPHILQWQAIKDAKSSECWFYDFWGATPPDSKGREQNWGGFTRFKMGFSSDAELTEYIGTYEKLYKPVQAGVYRFLQKIYKQ